MVYYYSWYRIEIEGNLSVVCGLYVAEINSHIIRTNRNSVLHIPCM